jgi:DNA-binding LytR/AlgR family response regulator
VARLALVSFAGGGVAFEVVSEIIRRWIKPDYLPFASVWHLELLAAILGLAIASAATWTFYLRLRIELEARSSEMDALGRALAQLPSAAPAAAPFLVRHRNGTERVPESEVAYFAAEDEYVFLCTEENRFFYDATLKELETRLDASAFLRIHRGYIVALRRVRRVHRGAWGDLQVELDVGPGLRLPVGRAYRAKVRAHLGL